MFPGQSDDDTGEQRFHKMKCQDCHKTNTEPGKMCPYCGSLQTVPASY